MAKKQSAVSGGRLKKELGLFSGVSLVAGMTIGSGIYYLGSYVLERTNMSMGMALICWLIGGGEYDCVPIAQNSDWKPQSEFFYRYAAFSA